MASTVSFNVIWSDYLLSMLHKVPIVVASALVVLSLTTCGGLALCLGAIFYFLRLTQMSQDFVEEVVWLFVKNFAKKFRNFFKRAKKPEKTSIIIAAESSEHVTEPQASLEQIENVKLKDTESELKDTLEREEEPSTSASATNIEEVDIVENSEDDKQEAVENDEVVVVQNKTGERIENVHDDLENENTKNGSKISEAYNAIFFHSFLFFIWCIITLINVPAVLTWAHNFNDFTITLLCTPPIRLEFV
nr:uncharacterized protein LOC111506859 [Leptinotarsa decemlineata]